MTNKKPQCTLDRKTVKVVLRSFNWVWMWNRSWIDIIHISIEFLANFTTLSFAELYPYPRFIDFYLWEKYLHENELFLWSIPPCSISLRILFFHSLLDKLKSSIGFIYHQKYDSLIFIHLTFYQWRYTQNQHHEQHNWQINP